MFRRGHFRFGFVLLLAAFLVISTSEAISVPKGCAEVASAWIKNPQMGAFVQDAKTLTTLLDCIQGMYQLIQQFDWKTAQTMIPKEVQGLMQKIPNLMEKAKKIGGKDMFLLSVYLGYRSIELYDRANSLKIDFKLYRQEFDLLKQELKAIKEFLDTEIVPQWKNGKMVNMPRNTEKYIEMLSRYSEVLRKLVHAIYSDVKQGSSDRIWSFTYGVSGVGVCVGSVFTGNPVVFVPTCGVGLGTAAVNVKTYVSLGETLEGFDLLWEDTAEMRTEITKYRTILELVKMRHDF